MRLKDFKMRNIDKMKETTKLIRINRWRKSEKFLAAIFKNLRKN